MVTVVSPYDVITPKLITLSFDLLPSELLERLGATLSKKELALEMSNLFDFWRLMQSDLQSASKADRDLLAERYYARANEIEPHGALAAHAYRTFAYELKRRSGWEL